MDVERIRLVRRKSAQSQNLCWHPFGLAKTSAIRRRHSFLRGPQAQTTAVIGTLTARTIKLTITTWTNNNNDGQHLILQVDSERH
ncbi:hypothetical protein QR685DRAFT_446862 [Neurospora intermedia]|uniref:Uncharacterized protein n=1 Tax=Neurospora intermedia TaxID=5142 RepID=A0ABR3D6W9_NEUIN